jgi:hypothetical protein
MWWIFGALALFSALFGGIFIGWAGMVEGISIIVATAVIILVNSLVDYFKDQKLLGLQS